MMLVLSSPSGAGKTTLSRRLLQADNGFSMSVSVTTRAPRPGEQDGVDYHFIDEATFVKQAANGELLEWASVFGHHYGTPRAPVEAALAAGRDVLFDIDWQGTQQIRARMGADVVSVFILPPSAAALEERLLKRAQDSQEVVAGRMAKAADEISHWQEYDFVFVNDDIDRAFAALEAIVASERIRRTRRETGLLDLVQRLQRDLESRTR
ncbi:MAG: guanylate kinase [Hyphomicrobiaceae bacterium]